MRVWNPVVRAARLYRWADAAPLARCLKVEIQQLGIFEPIKLQRMQNFWPSEAAVAAFVNMLAYSGTEAMASGSSYQASDTRHGKKFRKSQGLDF